MSLYQCEKCGALENTSLGSYWGEKEKLCSECATGVWHNEFTKILLPKGEFKTTLKGDLEHIESGSEDYMKFAISPAGNE